MNGMKIVQKKNIIKRVLSTSLMLLWMVVIFAFSARNATESTTMSTTVGTWVCEVFVPGFEDWSLTEQQDLAQQIDYPVRKMAHGLEYTALGILTFLCAASWSGQKKLNKLLSGKWMWFLCWVICILYASSDEFHQLFVPGRSGQVTDVMIDSLGALVGIGFCCLVQKLLKHRKNHFSE